MWPAKPHADPRLRRIEGYRNWFCVTPVAVDMEMSLMLSCVGPASWDTSPKNPHVTALYKVYVNRAGKAAMQSKEHAPFPAGSVVVKEKYERKSGVLYQGRVARVLRKDAKPVLLTVMVKHEKGYAPANGDWEYMVVSGDGSKETTAGLEHCAACHATQKTRDFVFRSYQGMLNGAGDPPPSLMSPNPKPPKSVKGR
jgi:hypothetical protein